MSPRIPVGTALVIGLFALAGCSSPASSPHSESSASESAPPSDGTDSAASSTAPESDADSDGDLAAMAAELEAIIPGLGSADAGPAQDVCGMLLYGTDRQTIELTAAGEYAPFVESGIIDGDQAKQIVEVVDRHCS